MRKNVTEEERSLGALLRLPYEALQRETYGALAAQGYADVRPAHGVVFRYILPDGSRVTELAERASMTKQSMAYLVESLAEGGYVKVGPDAADGRAKIVHLTAKGRGVQRAALEMSRRFEKRMAGVMGEKVWAGLREGLGRLCEVVEGKGC